VVLINATADQLNGFPIFLVLLGAILLAAEVFVIPGFGIAGVLGFLAVGAGFLFLAGGATIGEPSVDASFLYDFGFQFILTALGGMTLLAVLSRWLPSVGPARRLVLAAPEGPSPGSVVDPERAPARVGQRGTARSTLRPSGTAEIDGRLVDVTAVGAFVDPGQVVEVVAVEGNHVDVRPVEPEDAQA
jgi:membrane-bound serine protease (ClpP class)